MRDRAANAHRITTLSLVLRESTDVLDGGEDWQVWRGSLLGATEHGDAQQHRHDQDHPGRLSLHGGRNTIPGHSGRPVEMCLPDPAPRTSHHGQRIPTRLPSMPCSYY